MPVCLKCHQKYQQLGTLCSCGQGYSVKDECKDDPVGLLGQLVSSRFVPVAIIEQGKSVISYEIVQTTIERTLTMLVVRPDCYQHTGNADVFQAIVERSVSLKQRNLPTIIDIFAINGINTVAATVEARKGEKLSTLIANGQIDFVSIMHIAHQILLALTALQTRRLTFPGFGMDNIYILRSGGDPSFVKICGYLESNLTYGLTHNALHDDVFCVGQLILSLITGKQPPFTTIELPKDKDFLLPIAQIFMRAIQPLEQRFSSCSELLYAFETAFELNTRENDTCILSSAHLPKTNDASRHRSPLPLDQIIWMHAPPQRG